MSTQYVISIMTRDRVGIIADVTGVIKKYRGNLADLSQTVLSGYFTMILIASFPKTVKEATLRQALEAIESETPLEIGIKRRQPPEAVVSGADTESKYVVTAVGPDTIGLVAAVSEYLRQKKINIEDFATRVDGDRYWMILLVTLPPDTELAKLKRSLKLALAEIGVTVELQHHDIFRATNEV